MPIPSEQELLKAACHFGHKRNKWNPKIAPYIYGVKDNIHIFDLQKTREHLENTCKALKEFVKRNQTILFVSTKQQTLQLVENTGKKLGQPTVTKKWIPGLLTNWSTVKKRLKYYLDLQKSFRTGEIEKYTKKEITSLRKELTKLDAALSGVSDMSIVPDAVFVIDAVRDHVAVTEANKLGIPVFGICDSNADPTEFTDFIPANDDAVRSVEIILKTIEENLSQETAGKPRKKPAEEDKEVPETEPEPETDPDSDYETESEDSDNQ